MQVYLRQFNINLAPRGLAIFEIRMMKQLQACEHAVVRIKLQKSIALRFGCPLLCQVPYGSWLYTRKMCGYGLRGCGERKVAFIVPA